VTDRVLLTVLFTDIVGSTDTVAEIGAGRWRAILARHDALVRRHLARYQGREVKTTGDGFLATFDGPARAIRCGHAITEPCRQVMQIEKLDDGHPLLVHAVGPQFIDQSDQIAPTEIGMVTRYAADHLADGRDTRAEMAKVALQVALLVLRALLRAGGLQLFSYTRRQRSR
jgi:hypothetical protein